MFWEGTEVKSIRAGKCSIADSYAVIRNGEASVVNMYMQHEEGNRFNHLETRSRKLYYDKNEILKLNDKVRLEGYTLIPLKLYFKRIKQNY